MAAQESYLAVDIGAESGRTMIAQFDGSKMLLEETHRFANGGVRCHDTLVWNLIGLWQNVKVGIGKSLSVEPALKSVGIDTWGVDFGFLDLNGQLLQNPVQYRDERTVGMMERAFSKVGKWPIYAETGVQFMRINSLYQLLAIAHSKSNFIGVRHMLFIPDLLNYFLSGELLAEYTVASTSQMLNAETRTWSLPILQGLGIPTAMLPNIEPPGTLLGHLHPSVINELGVGQQLEVIASASHDTAAAVVAVPAVGNDWCFISSGTWSLMGAEISNPCISEETLEHNFTNEGGVENTIRFLKNIMGLWLVQECRRSFERSGKVLDYERLTKLAESARDTGIFNPDHDSLLSPIDMPAAIQKLCADSNQTVPETEGEMVRSCLRSLALRYRATLNAMEKLLNKKFKVIHVVGGGSQNGLLCQWTADCCNRIVVAGPTEGTAMGNALVQAMAMKRISSLADARAVVKASSIIKTYEPRQHSAWDDTWSKFCELN